MDNPLGPFKSFAQDKEAQRKKRTMLIAYAIGGVLVIFALGAALATMAPELFSWLPGGSRGRQTAGAQNGLSAPAAVPLNAGGSGGGAPMEAVPWAHGAPEAQDSLSMIRKGEGDELYNGNAAGAAATAQGAPGAGAGGPGAGGGAAGAQGAAQQLAAQAGAGGGAGLGGGGEGGQAATAGGGQVGAPGGWRGANGFEHGQAVSSQRTSAQMAGASYYSARGADGSYHGKGGGRLIAAPRAGHRAVGGGYYMPPGGMDSGGAYGLRANGAGGGGGTLATAPTMPALPPLGGGYNPAIQAQGPSLTTGGGDVSMGYGSQTTQASQAPQSPPPNQTPTGSSVVQNNPPSTPPAQTPPTTTKPATTTSGGIGGGGGGGAGGCFVAGTRVLTPRGPAAIETIRPGDVVYSADPKTGLLVPEKVLGGPYPHPGENLYLVTLEDGAALRATAHHPFYDVARSEYRAAEDLAPGDQLLAFDPPAEAEQQLALAAPGLGAARADLFAPGTIAAARPAAGAAGRVLRVVSVRALSLGPTEVYNLTMDGPYHNFVAEGVLVHNVQVAEKSD